MPLKGLNKNYWVGISNIRNKHILVTCLYKKNWSCCIGLTPIENKQIDDFSRAINKRIIPQHILHNDLQNFLFHKLHQTIP